MTSLHFSLADDQHSTSTYSTERLLNTSGRGLVIVKRVHSSRALNNSEKLQQKEVPPINSSRNEECEIRQAASCLLTAQNVELQPRQAEGLVGWRGIKGLHVYL